MFFCSFPKYGQPEVCFNLAPLYEPSSIQSHCLSERSKTFAFSHFRKMCKGICFHVCSLWSCCSCFWSCSTHSWVYVVAWYDFCLCPRMEGEEVVGRAPLRLFLWCGGTKDNKRARVGLGSGSRLWLDFPCPALQINKAKYICFPINCTSMSICGYECTFMNKYEHHHRNDILLSVCFAGKFSACCCGFFGDNLKLSFVYLIREPGLGITIMLNCLLEKYNAHPDNYTQFAPK